MLFLLGKEDRVRIVYEAVCYDACHAKGNSLNIVGHAYYYIKLREHTRTLIVSVARKMGKDNEVILNLDGQTRLNMSLKNYPSINEATF